MFLSSVTVSYYLSSFTVLQVMHFGVSVYIGAVMVRCRLYRSISQSVRVQFLFVRYQSHELINSETEMFL